MGLNRINEKLNTLLKCSNSTTASVELDYDDIQIPSFEIRTERGRTRFSIEKGKGLSESPDPEVMNMITAFYAFSKHTLIHEWNQNKPEQAPAIEQLQFDLDIPTAQTLQVDHEIKSDQQIVYQIKYLFHEERQIIRLDYVLVPVGKHDPVSITYRAIIFLLGNLAPVSDKTVRALIKKLHADIMMDAVFYAITSNNIKVDLVLVKKFIKEHKPDLIVSDDPDVNEFLPVYDRPYTTKRNVRLGR
ncbi:MAG: hypothetical protein ABJB16_15965 [Saprospiraceae bacterium]